MKPEITYNQAVINNRLKHLIQDLRKFQQMEEEEQRQKDQAEYERMKFVTFEISILYWDTYHTKYIPDTFEIEGIEFANLIYDTYKQNAWDRNIHSITLTENGRKVRRNQFVYQY